MANNFETKKEKNIKSSEVLLHFLSKLYTINVLIWFNDKAFINGTARRFTVPTARQGTGFLYSFCEKKVIKWV